LRLDVLVVVQNSAQNQEIKNFWENKLIMMSEYYKQLFTHEESYRK